jgi:hypothetical protein
VTRKATMLRNSEFSTREFDALRFGSAHCVLHPASPQGEKIRIWFDMFAIDYRYRSDLASGNTC